MENEFPILFIQVLLCSPHSLNDTGFPHFPAAGIWYDYGKYKHYRQTGKQRHDGSLITEEPDFPGKHMNDRFCRQEV